ncbi:MAG TPA: methyltransferase domain-containing protein [Steroidobacteraceae bacterium]|jgi:demethylmenaquinone methyltransferase/2-methoxy-6-polyprenyl-1,4-benzoquinol methylase
MRDDLQAYYAARANEYDKVYAKPERQADLRAMQRWLQTLLCGQRVLEVACGTGYWTQFIEPIAKCVVALDVAEEVLRIARERVPDERVRFVVGDAYCIPPALGSFNAAFAGFWFSHIPRSRQREFLLHLNERLETGSRIVLLDNLYVEGSSTALSERDCDGNSYQLRPLADGSVHRVLKNFPTEQDLRALATGSGNDLHFTRWQYYWGFDYATRR